MRQLLVHQHVMRQLLILGGVQTFHVDVTWLVAKLKALIQIAKQGWFKDLLDDPDVLIWDLAKWHHRHWARTLPPIQNGEGLTMEGPRMAMAFRTRFFPADHVIPDPVPEFSFDPFPSQEFYPVSCDKVTAALQKLGRFSGKSHVPKRISHHVNGSCRSYLIIFRSQL
jgi:hypothetical protein